MIKIKRSKIIYNNCDIPAKMFFDELMQGNASVLGHGSSEDIHNAYMNIIDEYCDLDNNIRMIDWFKKQEKISCIQIAISNITTLLYIIKKVYNPKNERQKEAVTLLNKIKYTSVRFDDKKPLNEEIIRVESVVLGVLRNDLNMEISTEKHEQKEIKKEFLKRLVAIENCLGRAIDDDISLRRFIYLEKSAIKKSIPQK